MYSSSKLLQKIRFNFKVIRRTIFSYKRKKARLPRVRRRRYAAKNRWQPGKFPGWSPLSVSISPHILLFKINPAYYIQNHPSCQVRPLSGYSKFCVGFFNLSPISTERFLPTFLWDFSFKPRFRASDFFQLLCGISSE